MDMSGMSGMNGMGGAGGDDASSMTMSGGIFTPGDKAIARGFWYGVAGVVGLFTAARVASILDMRRRLNLTQRHPRYIASRPQGWLFQSYATATATFRELVYSQPLYFTGRFSKYFSPLPVGRWLLLAFYWTVVLCFLWTDTILKPSDPMYAYKWEKVGFRAAWVTVTQIPFVYLLSCKFNPISLLTGISYERFNWLHRWAARTVFLTAIVHWSFFYTEWSIYKMVMMEIEMMPMVKYGFGAWAVITWMMLTGFGFFRNLNYELFVVQHIAGAAVLLWLLFVHVPAYARYNIWLSVSFVVFDWGVRLVWAMVRNLHVLGHATKTSPGFRAKLEPLPGDVVRLTIDDVDFDWKAGQHAYIAMPGLRPFETHPFTIASAPTLAREGRSLKMLIQARSGFSRSLHKAANRHGVARHYRTFISGPWGAPPELCHYDTIVFIACSSGATFIVPLLQDAVRRRGCVRTISMHWIIRQDDHFGWFGDELKALAEDARTLNLDLQILIHVTQSSMSPSLEIASNTEDAGPAFTAAQDLASDAGSELTSVDSRENEKLLMRQRERRMDGTRPPILSRSYRGRPSLDAMIRPEIENALGEAAVVVCGGLSITAESRTYVAALSDERAVHKGTDAQGIFLFTETYGW